LSFFSSKDYYASGPGKFALNELEASEKLKNGTADKDLEKDLNDQYDEE